MSMLTLNVRPDPDARTSARWVAQLVDPDVRRWYDAMAIKSKVTASERLRVLTRYCEARRTTPGELLTLAQRPKGTTKIANDLQDFAILMSKPHTPEDHGAGERDKDARRRCAEGHSGGYILQFIKSIRGFLRANDIGLVRSISVGDANRVRTVENERIPPPAELRKVLLAASPRAKVIIAFCGLAGLRPEVLGTMDLEDGLRLADLPDVVITDGGVKVRKSPALVVVRRELSKVRKRYVTFLPREGCEFLRTYLATRLLHGEPLAPDSPVVRPDYGFDRKGRPEAKRGLPFLGRQGVTKEIRQAFRAVRLQARPYVLRSYFASALLSGQREGAITDLERELFLGRANAISMRYTLHKDLPAKEIEALRDTFRRLEPFLSTKAVDASSADAATVDELREMYLRTQENMKALEARLAAPKSELAEALLADPEARRILERAVRRSQAKAPAKA